MNEGFLFQQIQTLFPRKEYAVLPQVANRTGFGISNYADALALSLWPSRGLHLFGFEIKCSKADFKREIDNPEKAEAIAKYCHRWYIVAASEKVAPVEDVPAGWGLFVYDEKKGLVKKREALFREDVAQPTWPFIASILRKVQEVDTPESLLKEADSAGYARGLEEGKRKANYELESLREEKKKWWAFTKASGVDIDLGWQRPEKIGEAVKAVLNGDQERWRNHLLSISEEIQKKLQGV